MKKIIYLLLLLPVLAIAQSQDQNYVKTIIYRDTTNTLAPHESVTYYDGLGRPIQQLAGKMSASGMDIITHIEYDSYGRQVKKYLPYPTDRATLEFDSAARTNTVNYYVTKFNDSIAYSQSFLEPSPLGRVLKQSAPGAAWKGNQGDDNDKTIKYSQQVNVANEVRRLKANANLVGSVYEPTFVNGGNYAVGKLYKTVTKDENWTSGRNNTTEEFRNKDGQLILQRAYIDGVTADTYYVYDQFGNLTYVLPPKAQGTITYLENLCYRYKYDKRNRLVEKKLPGKRTEYIVYDSQDRVIATGPTLTPFGGATATAADQGWLRTYYDVFGRVAFTGWYQQTVDASAWATLQNDNNGVPIYAKRGSSTIDNIALGYNTPSGLPTSFKLLSVNYYDNYLWMAQSDRPTASTQVEGVKISLSTKGLLTGSWVRALEGASSTVGETTYRYYDYRGRALRTKATNYLGGYTQEDGKFDFIGTPLYSKIQFRKLSSGTVTNIWEGFEYSDQGRLLGHAHQINSLEGQKLSTNTYNELGQLVSKNVGGALMLGNSLGTYQKVDYKYNIRGWLTDINNVDSLQTETLYPEDLFAYRINYNTIGDDLNDRIKPLYNGNISETQWISAQDNVLRKYSYAYDSGNRLKDAYYQKPGQAVPEAGSYNESLMYDINGNIERIIRTGGLDDPNTVVNIDNLKLKYYENSNRLFRVDDSSYSPQGFSDLTATPDAAEYAYDDNGNMLSDLNKRVMGITYNHLNLPVVISFGGGNSITYLYNAAGVKLKKTVVENSNTVVIDYLSGFQYKNGALQFFPTAEGYVDYTPVGTGGTYNYVYQYRDHLGNVRMNYAYSPPFKTDPGGLKIKEESHYYPFGLRHLNYNMDYLEYKEIEDEIVLYPPVSTGGKLVHAYKYNGQEFEQSLGLNMSEMSFRQYDPALGRFVTTDALAHRSYSLTPYHFGFNNPVYFNDPTGLSPDIKGILMDLFDLSRAPITKWVNNSGIWTSDKQQWYDQYSRESGETLPELQISKDNYGRGLQEYLSIRIKDHVYWNSGNYQWWRDGVAEQQWDEVQTTLDYLGTVPVIGEPIDAVNAGISAIRGDYAAAGLSMGAMIPIGGWAFTGLKIGGKATTRVFWSGGDAAKDAAMAFAKANGGKTLEMTFKGGLMNAISPYLPRSVSTPIWNKLSLNFAKGASGTVDFITTTAGPRAQSIWNTVEKPVLESNSVNIITHLID
ncbi:type IV secretion protein Rhs [Flavobacterium sp. Sd200]|uniref:DUF6443 domain-containing protein n=1 Tax=Flavobacterium sp. Sd200 TaxID=2692211 RepID=UPI00136B8541|nr:DUF6443 domain-containing protein [Flavobacterium sp. Sd200]MXN91128.1 type IV secretion protein Rhs [Flavobacterium sp. Sd200]